MLRIQDKDGKTKFVLKDEDEEPTSIDDLIFKPKKNEGDSNAEKKSSPDAGPGDEGSN